MPGVVSRSGGGSSSSSPTVVSGNVTPADDYANPTTAIVSYALVGVWDGNFWQRARGGLVSTAIDASDLALTLNSLPTGQYLATPPSLADTEGHVLQLTTNGYLKMAEQFAPVAEDNTNGVYGVVQKPLATNTYAPTLFSNFGTDPDVSIKGSAGNVFGITCHNLNAAARFFQLHNKASAPGAGETPLLTFLVPGSSMIVIGQELFGPNGVYFSTGIASGFSTTEATYTAGTSTDQFVQVTYK